MNSYKPSVRVPSHFLPVLEDPANDNTENSIMSEGSSEALYIYKKIK